MNVWKTWEVEWKCSDRASKIRQDQLLSKRTRSRHNRQASAHAVPSCRVLALAATPPAVIPRSRSDEISPWPAMSLVHAALAGIRTSAPGVGTGLVAVHGRDTLSDTKTGAPPQPVNFNREVRPILSKNCFACHGSDEAKRAKGLRLDVREQAVKTLKSGEAAIVPGDPDSSSLVSRIGEEDETLRCRLGKRATGFRPPRLMFLPAGSTRGRTIRGIGAVPPGRAVAECRQPRLDEERHRLLGFGPARAGGAAPVSRRRTRIPSSPREPGPWRGCPPRPMS